MRSCAGSTTTRGRRGSSSRVADGRAQATISGGGRYDGLAEQIGGKRTPGVGFGCGVERVVLALESAGRAPTLRGCDWFCAVDAPDARPTVGALLDERASQRPRGRDGSRRPQPEGAAPSRATARSARRERHRRRGVGAPASARVGDDEVPLAGLVAAVIELLMIEAEDR